MRKRRGPAFRPMLAPAFSASWRFGIPRDSYVGETSLFISPVPLSAGQVHTFAGSMPIWPGLEASVFVQSAPATPGYMWAEHQQLWRSGNPTPPSPWVDRQNATSDSHPSLPPKKAGCDPLRAGCHGSRGGTWRWVE